MITEHLTDRMPDVRHGHDAWTAADLAHLERCPECTADWLVVRAVRVPDVASIDTEALATKVLRRLIDEPVVLPMRRPAAWRRTLIGLAAAASVAVAFLLWQAPRSQELAFVPSREATMLPELDDLLDAELEVVLASIASEADDPLGTVPSFGDLTDEELEKLLEEVEG